MRGGGKATCIKESGCGVSVVMVWRIENFGEVGTANH